MYHFSDTCVHDKTKVGRINTGKYLVFEDDVCWEIVVIKDSVFEYWNESKRVYKAFRTKAD